MTHGQALLGILLLLLGGWLSFVGSMVSFGFLIGRRFSGRLGR